MLADISFKKLDVELIGEMRSKMFNTDRRKNERILDAFHTPARHRVLLGRRSPKVTIKWRKKSKTVNLFSYNQICIYCNLLLVISYNSLEF